MSPAQDHLISDQLRRRAIQLWTEFGSPTEELLALNQQYHIHHREHISRDDYLVHDGDIGSRWSRVDEIRNWTSNLFSRRPTELGHPALMDTSVHTYWHMFLEAAKRLDEDDPDQYMLTVELLFARNRTLQHAFGDELVPVYASNGQKIWSDLPYLYENLHVAFQGHLTQDQRTNLSAFTARLAASGILDNKLFELGLMLFRDAFETPRQLVPSQDNSEVSIQELLPAVNCWMHYTRYQIEDLVQDDSTRGWESFDGASPGPLAPTHCPSSFSLTRWKFWGQRLSSLEEQQDHGDFYDSVKAIQSWWELIDNHSLGGPNLGGATGNTRFWVKGPSS